MFSRLSLRMESGHRNSARVTDQFAFFGSRNQVAVRAPDTSRYAVSVSKYGPRSKRSNEALRRVNGRVGGTVPPRLTLGPRLALAECGS